MAGGGAGAGVVSEVVSIVGATAAGVGGVASAGGLMEAGGTGVGAGEGVMAGGVGTLTVLAAGSVVAVFAVRLGSAVTGGLTL